LRNYFVIGPHYVKLIKDRLFPGVKIEGISIQSHRHAGYRGTQSAWECCDRFARFGNPPEQDDGKWPRLIQLGRTVLGVVMAIKYGRCRRLAV
jgi:hypothetical protein